MERRNQVIDRQLIFAAFVPPAARDGFWNAASLKTPNYRIGEQMMLFAPEFQFSPRKLKPAERVFLDATAAKTKSKLAELGLGEISRRLPIPEAVYLVDVNRSYSLIRGEGLFPQQFIEGDCDEYHQFIMLWLPAGESIETPVFELNFHHEASHLAIPAVLGAHYETTAFGFDRVVRVSAGKHGRVVKRGIYGEPLSELFAWFCMDYEAELPIHYFDQVALMIPMLERFAAANRISPLDAFCRAYKALVLRDFSFQAELISVFGTEAVKGFNNYQDFVGMDNLSCLTSLADMAGLGDRYRQIQQLPREGVITFPGMKVIGRKSAMIS